MTNIYPGSFWKIQTKGYSEEGLYQVGSWKIQNFPKTFIRGELSISKKQITSYSRGHKQNTKPEIKRQQVIIIIK